MGDGDMESSGFAFQPSDCDVHDSMLHDYKYSRDACSPESCISFHLARFLVFLPSLLLFRLFTKKEKVSRLEVFVWGQKISNLLCS